VESLLAILLVLTLGMIACLLHLYFSLKGQIPRLLREQQQLWQAKEIQTIRQEQTALAQQDALVQLESWRQQELNLVRQQQLALARNEAQLQIEQWKAEYSQVIRQDAIQKSQAVTLGKVTEHFIPYLPDFAYNPKDARFLGSPVDFIVFDGLSDGEVKEVVLIEVKTGSSALSSRERRIRDAIQCGRVRWEELRPRWEPAQIETS
jgi:predicted Holliday junction resolvase-like endonuclease